MGHFYMQDGTPFYEVPNKSRGGMRPANIRDAKAVGAYPSVTTIISMWAAPGLENWKVDQAILAALTNPDIRKDMTLEEVKSIIKRDSMEQAKQAAERGTIIHDMIEAHLSGKRVARDFMETVMAVEQCLESNCGQQEWEPEKWFCHPLGYGGKVDLVSPEWIVDFKTKEGDVRGQIAYDNHHEQLEAYDYGLGGGPRKKAIVFVSRDIPDSVEFIPLGDRPESLESFKLALAKYQIAKGYPRTLRIVEEPKMEKAA